MDKRFLAFPVILAFLVMVPIIQPMSGTGDGYNFSRGTTGYVAGTGAESSHNVSLGAYGQPVDYGTGGGYRTRLGFYYILNDFPTQSTPWSGAHLPNNTVSSIDDDIVGHWQLEYDNGTHVFDETGKNNGTLNGPNITHEGRVGKAYQFDGSDDYIDVSSETGLTPSTDFSWSAWIYPKERGVSGGDDNGIITRMTIGASGKGYNMFMKDLAQNKTGCGIRNGTIAYYSTSNSGVNLYEWYHVTCVYNGTHLMQYLDGVLQSDVEATTFNSITYDSPTFKIGRYYTDSASYRFNGTIDEVVIWNRSLSATEISEVYNKTSGSGNIYRTEDLGCSPNSTFDADNDNVTSIYNWYRNNLSVMVLNMQFEGGSDSNWTRDYSSFNNYGTVEGATWNPTGGYDNNGAYGFDGDDDYVSIADDDSLDLSQVLTISAWVYPKNTTTKMIAGKGSAYLFAYAQSGNRLYFNAYNGTSWALYSLSDADSVTETNQWLHVAVTFDNTTGKVIFYKNGNEIKTLTGKHITTIYDSASSLEIGRLWSAWEFNGTIDAVTVWNRSLSSEQILALYRNRTSTIVSQETTKGENWTCSVTPNDRTEDGFTTYGSNMSIMNALPTAPSLYDPANESTVIDTTPTFMWNASSDADGDSIIYRIVVDDDSGFGSPVVDQSGISNLNYTPGTPITCGKTYYWKVRAWDGAEWGSWSDTWNFYISCFTMKITKTFSPDIIVAQTNEAINVTVDVKVNRTENSVPSINITDEVPWDFTAPGAGDVLVYFIDYSPSSTVDITNNVSININDLAGEDNTLVEIVIDNVSETDAGTYMEENDTIRITYLMTSSHLLSGGNRSTATNSTAEDNESNTAEANITSTIKAYSVVLRNFKKLWIPDPSASQNASVAIVMQSLGGPVTNILMADYLPMGAVITGINITYHNSTSGVSTELFNVSDYLVLDPFQDTLPDGSFVDIYHYNLSYNFTNWDGNIHNNDSINITYNITVLGGGLWVLPTVIAGYDPQYQKHIRTESHVDLGVPMFDVSLSVINHIVEPGDVVRAALKMWNVAGPKIKVDTFVTYSVKDMKGELVTERSQTMAVITDREIELSLRLPGEIESGMYTFEGFVTYTKREAMSTDVFEVRGEIISQGPGMSVEMLLGVVGALIAGGLVMWKRSRHPQDSTYRYKHKRK